VKVLFSFTPEDHSVSLAELARRTQLPKTTLHRLVGDLVQARMLDRVGDRYRLSRQLFELGMRASVERGLLEVATPFMEDLYERTHETVHLGVRDGIEVVYVSKIGGHRQAATPSRVGGRMPMYCTAIGKVLLAYSPRQVLREVVAAGLVRRTPRTITAPGTLQRQLNRIAATGLAYEYEESATGIVCIAAPILDPADTPLAAISITGPVSRFRPDAHSSSIRAAASGIASTLARRAAMRS